MKISLFGATGMIGQRILKEALTRGHLVTAIVRDPARLSQQENLNVVIGDILDEENVTNTTFGHDAVISAFGPKVGTGEEKSLIKATRCLINGVKRAKVARLIATGGAGSLEVAPGVLVLDMPEFPEIAKPIALAHLDALGIYQQESELNWTNLSPALSIKPGERTGKYRVGTEQLVADDKGESRISAEDYAVAILDELEDSKFSRKRFTVAY